MAFESKGRFKAMAHEVTLWEEADGRRFYPNLPEA